MRVVLILLLACAGFAAHAEVSVRVSDTDPVADAALGRDEPFYLRIQYRADAPARIWARPFFNGQPVAKGWKSNASPGYEGSGYALGWLSFDVPAEVDEVRILVAERGATGERVAASYPVRLRWSMQVPAARARPSWVAALQADVTRAFKDDYDRRMAEPAAPGTGALMSVFALAVVALLLGGVALPLLAIWKWRDNWRAAAGAPLAMFVLVILRIIVDVVRDPTSHNLWPFEILMWGAASLAIMVALFVARWFARRFAA